MNILTKKDFFNLGFRFGLLYKDFATELVSQAK